MKNYLKLLRWQNLLIILLTFIILRYCIEGSILKVNGYNFAFSTLDFAMLVLSVIFIAAGGYAINDYFDVETDEENGKFNALSNGIKPQTAVTLYLVLSAIGFGLGFYISYKIGHPKFSLIFFIAASLLWFYSSAFKKTFLLGNFIIAFLVGLIPLLIAIYDVPMLFIKFKKDIIQYGIDFNIITVWMLGYSIFAFGYTLLREIIKDTEDYDGDIASGANTLPIVLGQNAAKFIAVILDLSLVATISWIFLKYLHQFWSLIYFGVFLILPNFVLLYFLISAQEAKDYHKASTTVKLIMLFGIAYAFVACYIFSQI